MSDLLARQQKFARLLPRLLDHVGFLGLGCTVGEVYRSPAEAALNAQSGAGISNSLHCVRLAIDLQLFRDVIYLTDLESYRELGDYWASLDPDCRWGGVFSKPDPDHFSVTFEGRS